MAALAEPDCILEPASLSADVQASRRTVPINKPAPVDEITVRVDQPLPDALAAIERLMVRRALERTEGRFEEAARLLGISRKGLFLKRRRWGVQTRAS
jgi:DNA-binding NtrC family response regulator